MSEVEALASDLTFEDHGLNNGLWKGRLSGSAVPARVCVTLLGRVVSEVRLEDDGTGVWDIAAPLPSSLISGGVHSFVLMADGSEAGASLSPTARRLAVLSLIAGEALESDLRAELQLLRAEVELLKSALRAVARG